MIPFRLQASIPTVCLCNENETVVLAEKSITPPWSQMIVKGRVEVSNFQLRSNSTWMTHPSNIHDDVLLACTTVPGNTLTVQLVLVNGSDKKVIIDEDVCLAKLDPVKLCDIEPPNDERAEVVRSVIASTNQNTESEPESIEIIMRNFHSEVPLEERIQLDRLMTKYSHV